MIIEKAHLGFQTCYTGEKDRKVLVAYDGKYKQPTYYYKGKAYCILAYSKMKRRSGYLWWKKSWWEDVVIYMCLYENPDGMIFVREREEFFRLFTTSLTRENLPV